jgi:hypothetical protein
MPESFVQSVGGEGRADLLFHCPVVGANGELLIGALLGELGSPGPGHAGFAHLVLPWFPNMARREDVAIWSNETLDATTKLGLIILKHIFDEVPELEPMMDMLAQGLSQIPEQKRPDLMKAVYLYLLHKGGYPKEPLENAVDRIPEAQKMPFKTWAEGLREEGELIGVIKNISKMLENGADWDTITKLTQITPEAFERMKAQAK